MEISYFNFYYHPITNCSPHHKPVTVAKVHQFISGRYFKARTNHLRSIQEPKEAKRFKSMAFDFVTFSGLFSYRNIQNLISHSGLITIDMDHIPFVLPDHSPESLRKEILQSKEFEIALCFVSPSGDGIKTVVEIDLQNNTHQEWFEALSNYFETTWHIKPDPSGSDVSRPCFLPYDPECFIHPKYR